VKELNDQTTYSKHAILVLKKTLGCLFCQCRQDSRNAECSNAVKFPPSPQTVCPMPPDVAKWLHKHSCLFMFVIRVKYNLFLSSDKCDTFD